MTFTRQTHVQECSLQVLIRQKPGERMYKNPIISFLPGHAFHSLCHAHFRKSASDILGEILESNNSHFFLS